jgi:non-homologous end joining protein Ku
MKMAMSLIDAMSGPFHPGEFRDEYREKLLSTIERHAA